MKANGIKLIATMLVVLLPAIVVAQTFPELQKAEEETTIVEKKGGSVAMSPRFLSLDGNWYSLKEFFFEDRPVFLCMNYASCPQLCELQLKNLADQFHESKLVPGKDFEFISISLDPREARKKTREVKERFSRLMTGEADHKGIHFLIGKRDDIDQVAKSIGFFYSYVASVNHYSHAPVCVALSPDGRISRYIHGVGFTAEDLVESAETASDGKIAEKSVASFVYRCLMWINPGRYTKSLLGLMKLAGLVTVVVVGACVIPFWFRSPKVDSNQEASNLDGESETSSEAAKS